MSRSLISISRKCVIQNHIRDLLLCTKRGGGLKDKAQLNLVQKCNYCAAYKIACVINNAENVLWDLLVKLLCYYCLKKFRGKIFLIGHFHFQSTIWQKQFN